MTHLYISIIYKCHTSCYSAILATVNNSYSVTVPSQIHVFCLFPLFLHSFNELLDANLQFPLQDPPITPVQVLYERSGPATARFPSTRSRRPLPPVNPPTPLHHSHCPFLFSASQPRRAVARPTRHRRRLFIFRHHPAPPLSTAARHHPSHSKPSAAVRVSNTIALLFSVARCVWSIYGCAHPPLPSPVAALLHRLRQVAKETCPPLVAAVRNGQRKPAGCSAFHRSRLLLVYSSKKGSDVGAGRPTPIRRLPSRASYTECLHRCLLAHDNLRNCLRLSAPLPGPQLLSCVPLSPVISAGLSGGVVALTGIRAWSCRQPYQDSNRLHGFASLLRLQMQLN